jgi:hypothetical protein
VLDTFCGARRAFMGQVATRSFIPSSLGDTNTYMSRTLHYARDTITTIKIAIPNWLVLDNAGAGGGETASGGTTTVLASVEYPSGSFWPLYFSGSRTGTIASGGTLWTDLANVFIPNGALFFIRMSLVNTVGIPYTDSVTGVHITVSSGEALQQTATDLTTSGTVTDGFSGTLSMFPVAIVGRTTRPSICIIGDSRQTGLGDATPDATGDQGEIGRAFGPNYAYMSLAMSSERASQWATGSTQRALLAPYCTTIIGDLGINDTVFDGNAAATVEGNIKAIAAQFKPRRCYWTTFPPVTTGVWTNPAGTDQTVNGNDAIRTAVNDWTRAINPPLDAMIEVADTMEISRNSGKWHAPSFTTDGIHETTLANNKLLFANGGPIVSGLIPPGGFGFMPLR